MKIIYIAGIDGSGKTTLAKSLPEACRATGIKTKYFYARHIAVLLFPLRVIARIIALSGTHQFKDYSTYIKKKQTKSRKYKILGRLYAAVWFFDYWLVTQLRLLRHRVMNTTLIVDRYFYDVVMTISISLDLDQDKFFKFVQRAEGYFPEPSITFLLDLPEPQAFARKNDIQSEDYLRERKKQYQTLYKAYDWIKIDATQNPQQVREDVFGKLLGRLSKHTSTSG